MSMGAIVTVHYVIPDEAVNKVLGDLAKEHIDTIKEFFKIDGVLDEFVDEIWEHAGDFTIQNERIAEYIGRTKIAEFYQTTCAKDVEEFISECSTGFSGTPIDGSPFTRDDSDDYAREYWDAHHVED